MDLDALAQLLPGTMVSADVETLKQCQFRSFDPAPGGCTAVLLTEGVERGSMARLERALETAAGTPLEPDIATDTLEVAAIWSRVEPACAGVRAALSRRAEAVGCHCSHTSHS
jgi:hypothetical protein